MTIIGAAQKKKKYDPAYCLDVLLGEAEYWQDASDPEKKEIGETLGRLVDLLANALNVSLEGSSITEKPYETREAMREWFWQTYAGTAVYRIDI